MKLSEVIGNAKFLATLDYRNYLTETYQVHNIRALIDDLAHPGQDPRKEYKNISYREGVERIEDLKENMILEGRVTNVTNFGAFIDVGVHQDGLCHKSRMSDRFVRDPGELVSVGDIVQVQVLAVDTQKKRISLKLLKSAP